MPPRHVMYMYVRLVALCTDPVGLSMQTACTRLSSGSDVPPSSKLQLHPQALHVSVVKSAAPWAEGNPVAVVGCDHSMRGTIG